MSMNVNGNSAAQRAHNVKFTPLKAGVRKSDLQDPKLQSIFRQHDLNNNGILEENEAFRMNNALEKMMSNGKVSQSEVNNFAGQEQKNQFNISDMLNIVTQLGQASTAIASCVTNNQNQISVTYNPTEAGTLTENFNQQTGVLESNQTVKDNVTTMNNFTMIDGFENPVKTDTTIITMDPNNPQNTTPLTVENQQWTLPEGATEPVMTTQTILDNTTGTETTNYFSEDGTTLVGTLIQKGAQTIEMDGQGRTISNTQTLPNGMGEEVTTYEYAEGSDKPVKETTTSPLKGTITKETDGKKETVTTEKDGKKTVDVYENGVKKSQSYTDANGITYEVEYTASGNTKLKAFGPNGQTKGFFVQSGESIEKLAKQCGFDSVKEFQATMTNKKGESTTRFNVNNSFEMKGQVSAEDAAAFANGRKSMEVNRSQGNAAEVKRQEAEKAKQQAEADAQQAQIDAQKAEHQAKVQQEGTDIAKDLKENFRGARRQSGGLDPGSDGNFRRIISRVTPENVTEVLAAYNKMSPNESLMEAITDEKQMSTALRKKSITTLFDNLSARALQAGETETRVAQFREQFDAIMEAWENPSGVRGHYDAAFNYRGFDNLFSGMAEGIESLEGLPAEITNQIGNLTPEQHIKMVSDGMTNVYQNSWNNLKAQHDHDGRAGKIADAVGRVFNSKNTYESVKVDLKAYKKQIEDIQSATTMPELEAKFEEIYGLDYNPKLIAVYEQAHVDLVKAETHYSIEHEFNSQFGDLLSHSTLTNRTESKTSGGGKNMMMVTYESESKDHVYTRTYSQMTSMLGDGDSQAGEAVLNQYFASHGIDPNTATPEAKYKAMHNLAKECSAKFHHNTMDATGNKGIDSMRSDFKNKYYAAYGTKNDIAQRVTDYNISQEVGATVIKTGAKVVVVIAVTAATAGAGTGVSLAATAGTTFATDIAVDSYDRLSSNNGLSRSEFEDIACDAFVDAGLVIAGGAASKLVSAASGGVKSASLAKVIDATGNFAADVSLGAAAEFVSTGEVTVDGTLLNAGFAGFGAASQMRGTANKVTTGASGASVMSGGVKQAERNIQRNIRKGLTRKLEKSANDGTKKMSQAYKDSTENDSEIKSQNTVNIPSEVNIHAKETVEGLPSNTEIYVAGQKIDLGDFYANYSERISLMINSLPDVSAQMMVMKQYGVDPQTAAEIVDFFRKQ